MSESDQWKRVKKALAPLKPFRVENPALPGTPDVNFRGGWMELKWEREWPKRADTIVRCDHFTPQQKAFAVAHWRAGRNTTVLWTVEGQWMLFDGQTAAKIIGKVDRAELEARALRVWKPLDDADFLGYIRELALREVGP